MAKKTFYKFKAHETKAIVSAILNLENCHFYNDEDTGHAKLVLYDCNDNLLVEALNQITTVDAYIDDDNVLHTNYSRYIYKLNPELNKTRLKLLRILKPIGLFFMIRNLGNTNVILELSHPQFKSFLTKWESIYGNLEFKYDKYLNPDTNKDEYQIMVNNNFKNIINYAIDQYVIDDTLERRIFKDSLKKEMFEKIDYLLYHFYL